VETTLLVLALLGPAQESPRGDAEIRRRAGPSWIVLRTTSRLAGAVDSLTWNGKEFIDSFDHGRQLQSAASFGDGGPDFWAETYNPTEAGSRADGTGPTTTSVLLSLKAEADRLETRTRMAFWLKPGESSEGRPARNRTALSDHIVSKRITLGWAGLDHVLEYRVLFTVPRGESHRFAQFEAVTGYMPAEFSRFLAYDPARGGLCELSDGPGEQSLPVVLATPSGTHAMGVYSPDQPSGGFEHAGYGRFRFPAERVVKWNCVFRIRPPGGVRAGDHPFRTYVLVGSLADVTTAMKELHERLPPRRVATPPARLGLPALYRQYVDADGIPVVASERVESAALLEARDRVLLLLARRPDVREALVRRGVRVAILARSERTTDIPEYADLPREFPGTDWNRRAPGLEATRERPVACAGEENLLGLPEDPYRGEDILTHEFAHTMHTLGLRHADPEFERALRRAFENARSQGLWKGTYASTSPEEYWAEGVQSWFDRNRSADPPDGVHNAIATRERLRVYDPELARLLERVFGGD
jgi:hypothetical protein